MKRTFLGGHTLVREMRVHSSVHEQGEVSGHEALGLLGDALQVQSCKPAAVTVQFVVYYILQNFTSLLLRRREGLSEIQRV